MTYPQGKNPNSRNGFKKGHKVFKGCEKSWFTKEKRGPLPLEIRKKIGDANREEKSGLWTGDKVGYVGLHMWVYKHLGQPSYCAYCQSIDKKMYHWANISHCYRRDLSDWVRLCSSCHKLYDNGKIQL